MKKNILYNYTRVRNIALSSCFSCRYIFQVIGWYKNYQYNILAGPIIVVHDDSKVDTLRGGKLFLNESQLAGNNVKIINNDTISQ